MADSKKFQTVGYLSDGNFCIHGDSDYGLVGIFGAKKALVVDEHDLVVKEIANAVMDAIIGKNDD